MLPVITISREFGSGGHSIGKAVAEKLGIPFYDSEIVEHVASESGFAKDFIEEKGEYASRLSQLFGGPLRATPEGNEQDKIYKIQAEIIKKVAHEGPCVIVGRCADYILEEEDLNVMNVFIHAAEPFRKKRIMLRYGQNGIEIEERLKQKDKRRKTYYRFYTDRQWGDYHNYQLNLDSGYLGEDYCVELICKTAEKMSK